MFKEVKRNYKIINIVIFCICLYIFCFPIIATLIENISPKLTQCPYLILTGKPCPLCGGTRFITKIENVFTDISYIFNFFGIVIIITFFEIVFRIINIFKKVYSDNLIKIDIFLHLLMFILYTIYEIYYIINI